MGIGALPRGCGSRSRPQVTPAPWIVAQAGGRGADGYVTGPGTRPSRSGPGSSGDGRRGTDARAGTWATSPVGLHRSAGAGASGPGDARGDGAAGRGRRAAEPSNPVPVGRSGQEGASRSPVCWGDGEKTGIADGRVVIGGERPGPGRMGAGDGSGSRGRAGGPAFQGRRLRPGAGLDRRWSPSPSSGGRRGRAGGGDRGRRWTRDGGRSWSGSGWTCRPGGWAAAGWCGRASGAVRTSRAAEQPRRGGL